MKKTHKTRLPELTYGIRFMIPGKSDTYQTVTHPGIMTKALPGCKRPCWNVTKHRMEKIDYKTMVYVCD